ncbi:hypothetical protein CEXT_309711 [Caerostris extrusa]|uniref:Uncharacterized protein n=1 Tax=Caerostris extrusa TaxID=172846 RepID=A0AAV4NFD9_CAEEX|nr:hypothetical protein CEXT_309711 [Caerostris extrusa]
MPPPGFKLEACNTKTQSASYLTTRPTTFVGDKHPSERKKRKNRFQKNKSRILNQNNCIPKNPMGNQITPPVLRLKCSENRKGSSSWNDAIQPFRIPRAPRLGEGSHKEGTLQCLGGNFDAYSEPVKKVDPTDATHAKISNWVEDEEAKGSVKEAEGKKTPYQIKSNRKRSSRLFVSEKGRG